MAGGATRDVRHGATHHRHRKTDQLRIVGLKSTPGVAFATTCSSAARSGQGLSERRRPELVAQLNAILRASATQAGLEPQDSSERYVLAMGFRGHRDQHGATFTAR